VADDTITKAELEAALKRVNIMVGKAYSLSSYGLAYSSGMVNDKAVYPNVVANDLFRDVLAHREPEYQDGKVYRDADGDVYQYDVKYSGEKRWYEPGNSEEVPFTEPTRPLRLLG
jgi:hypothetical protein